jgi:hypothetical protein
MSSRKANSFTSPSLEQKILFDIEKGFVFDIESTAKFHVP